MKKHGQTLLIAWGVISTIATLYLFSTTQKIEQTNSILLQSNVAHKQLINNERESYEAINDCFVVKRGLCNANEFKNKLQALGNESEKLYEQISYLEKQIPSN